MGKQSEGVRSVQSTRRRDASGIQQQNLLHEHGGEACLLSLFYQLGRVGPQQMVVITLSCFSIYTLMAYHQHWTYERRNAAQHMATEVENDTILAQASSHTGYAQPIVRQSVANQSAGSMTKPKEHPDSLPVANEPVSSLPAAGEQASILPAANDPVANSQIENPQESPPQNTLSALTVTLTNKSQPQTDKILINLWSVPLATTFNKIIDNNCDSVIKGRCEFTEDKGRYDDSEAVVIGVMDSKGKMPTYRYPFQKWIYREGEPPPHVWDPHHIPELKDIRQISDVFNLTSTRNTNSDIILGPVSKACIIDEPHYKTLMKEDKNYAKGKNGRVAWFVSHCSTQSRREDYVTELRKYIPVDIYGKCGDKICGDRAHHLDCDATLLDTHYKFYLSFENSICDDYVTEKLTRISVHPISTIPIVLGGVDYRTFLPPQTYINVMDFESPRALADYLMIIDQDDNLFNTFIYRKLALVCHPFPDVEPYPCRLCTLLHEHRYDVIMVPDITAFYGVDTRCYAPEKVLSGVPFT